MVVRFELLSNAVLAAAVRHSTGVVGMVMVWLTFWVCVVFWAFWYEYFWKIMGKLVAVDEHCVMMSAIPEPPVLSLNLHGRSKELTLTMVLGSYVATGGLLSIFILPKFR